MRVVTLSPRTLLIRLGRPVVRAQQCSMRRLLMDYQS